MKRYFRALAIGLLGVALAAVAIAPVNAFSSQSASHMSPMVSSAQERAAASLATVVVAEKAKMKKPTGLHISFQTNGTYMSWKKVKGATSYGATIVSTTFIGPPQPFWTKKTHIFIPYTSISVDANSRLIFGVSAWSKTDNSATSKKLKISKKDLRFKSCAAIHKTKKGKLTKKSKSRVKKIAKRCLKDGGAMVVATAASGAGLMVASAWLPPAEAVTASGVALAAAGAGASESIYCAIIH